MNTQNVLLKSLLGPSLIVVFFGLSACNTETTYAPKSSDMTEGITGYSSEQLMADRYRVTFSGNEFTSRETVEKLLLYRAAELTKQQGYDGFEVVQDDTIMSINTNIDTIPAPGAVRAYPRFSPYYNFYGPTFGSRLYNPYLGSPMVSERTIIEQTERFDATAVIEMYSGEYKPESKQTFNASEVISRIGPVEEPSV